MHFWLPPAHANAPAPVSAVLSGLVVMASFYLLVRMWLDTFTAVLTPLSSHLPGVLGSAAILIGSLLAMRQQRLKMMFAYSTVAQVGYMVLTFPLYAGSEAARGFALNGGIYLSVAHACAKSAAFMAAGAVIYALGHDRIKDLSGLTRRYPAVAFTIALAGVSLIGLPPSAGFTGKWMLLKAAMISGQWGYAVVLVAGSLLSAIYIIRLLETFMQPADGSEPELSAPRWMTVTALVMALTAILLGFGADLPAELLGIGGPLDVTQASGSLP
jgi:formate hydrogenlyase subunit 3/multisubunit Na+/H+ antiporter MnhD subunit